MATPTTTEDHLRQVRATFEGAPDRRLGAILDAAVRHLHAFVTEVGLTHDEWIAGIRFLTDVGHTCDDVRQEFILLSDTLGVSMLLEMIHAPVSEGATEPTVLGPFYVEGAPARSFGESIVDHPGTGGDPLVLHGTVTDVDGAPVPGAAIEVWEVQPNGSYDIEEDPQRRNLRGVYHSDAAGAYEIRTVVPVDYTIPDDGPVGAMLRAAGRPSWRPAHVHLKISAPGYRTLVTHVFDAASPHLDSDVVFGVRGSIVASMAGGECRFDPVIEAV